MKAFVRLSAWLSRSLLQRTPALIYLRLEELEARTTPTVSVVPQQFSTSQYTALTITQDQLLAGDSGVSALSLRNPTPPAHATLADNHNGTYTFTPEDSFTGSTTFQYTVDANTQTKLTAADGSSAGGPVSISGDTAVISAPGEAAYVFVRSGGTWSQQAKLTVADDAFIVGFTKPVAVSGDTIVIGSDIAIGDTDQQRQGQGAAYVFVRSGSTWSQQAVLTAADGVAYDFFGESVSINGDTAVIGANSKTVQGQEHEGAAYVFVRSGGTWSQQAKLLAADGAANDEFGSAVSLSGDTAVVSVSPSSSSPGGAYVFVRSGNSWSQQAKLTAADAVLGDSVSLSGDTAVVIGTQSSNSQRAAYVFVRSGSTWTQQAKLTADGNPNFGRSVSISGDTAVVGVAHSGGSNQVAAYVFARTGNSWTQQATVEFTDLNPSQEIGIGGFGRIVSVSGDTVIIGDQNPFEGAVVENLDTATATATVQIKPASAQLILSPTRLPGGARGVAYVGPTFTASGGSGVGYTFQESGLLPPGLNFDPATAQLAGTPTQVGTFPGIVIAASDGSGGSGSQTYTLNVSGGVNGLPIPFPPVIYAPPTSRSEPDASDHSFIRGLYHSVLDRDIESDGSTLAYWENRLKDARMTPQQLGLAAWIEPHQYVAQGFWESEEHRYRQVESYYRTFLGRDLLPFSGAISPELQFWTDQFRIYGAKEVDVVRGFLTSAEYLFKHRTDASLANVVNTNLLSGTATAAHLQDWNGRLATLDAARVSMPGAGGSITPEAYKTSLIPLLGSFDDETARTGVLFDVLQSDEYRQPAVDSFFLAFYQRVGDMNEKQMWLSQRGAGGNPLDLGTIAEGVLSSLEYYGKATTV